MKKVKRLCIYPNKDTEPKMHTLYECHGKSGTTESTVLWFLEPPVKGMLVWHRYKQPLFAIHERTCISLRNF